MGNDRRSTPTWQWVAVTAITASMAMAAWGFQDTRKMISDLEKKKADVKVVEMMHSDVRDVKRMMESHIMDTGRGRVARR